MNKRFSKWTLNFGFFFKIYFVYLQTTWNILLKCCLQFKKNCFTKIVKGSDYNKNEIFQKMESSALLSCNGDQEQLPSSVSWILSNRKCDMSSQNFWYYYNLYCAFTVLGLMAIYFLFGRKVANPPKKKARKYQKTRPRKQKMRFYKRIYH